LKVGDQGFKVDAARISQHSAFLTNMFSDASIGDMKEGTVDNPIVLQGITATAFANFLGWLNHKYAFISWRFLC
jgi:hypothetical protein